MSYSRARNLEQPAGFGDSDIGAIISTELFNDFKAKAANFKSPATEFKNIINDQ